MPFLRRQIQNYVYGLANLSKKVSTSRTPISENKAPYDTTLRPWNGKQFQWIFTKNLAIKVQTTRSIRVQNNTAFWVIKISINLPSHIWIIHSTNNNVLTHFNKWRGLRLANSWCKWEILQAAGLYQISWFLILILIIRRLQNNEWIKKDGFSIHHSTKVYVNILYEMVPINLQAL